MPLQSLQKKGVSWLETVRPLHSAKWLTNAEAHEIKAVAEPAPIAIEVKRDAEAVEDLAPEYDIVKGVCHKLKRALEYLF